MLLRDVNKEQAAKLIDDLRQDFALVDFHAGDVSFHCTFSAGISDFPNYPTTQSLRLAADQALYRAKHLGRNQVASITESDNDGE